MKNIFSLLIITILLAGCSSFSKQSNYMNAKNLPPTRVPRAMVLGPQQTFYPIPPVSMAPMAGNPSLLPPGSRSAQIQAQKQMMTQANAPARTSAVIASSSTSLVLNLNYDQAWNDVGRALKSSGNKVMQQDKSMGAYYILDLAGTGGQLKTTTPIYRVSIKSVGNNMNVTLLDANNNLVNPSVSSRILGRLKAIL